MKVAEFAEPTDAHVWLLKQPPTFLIESLRDGVTGLGEAPLASTLAAGAIGGTAAPSPAPPGFHPARRTPTAPAWGKGCTWCGGHRAPAKQRS